MVDSASHGAQCIINTAPVCLERGWPSRAIRLNDNGPLLPKGTHFHDLRRYYASLLKMSGESVKVVQARLGHATAAETLDTYSHLWQDSEDRTRQAVDEVLAALLRPGRSL